MVKFQSGFKKRNTFMGMMWLMLIMLMSACGTSDITIQLSSSGNDTADISGVTIPEGDIARVINVIDGDTIDVVMDGVEYRVRYVGVNTPERDEPCYADARAANAALVDGQTVTLVRDTSDTDRFDRLLRYIYVGTTFVNAALVGDGYAEVVRYDPDDAYYAEFLDLERQATADGRGCHPTGIFNDGSTTR